MTNAFRRGTALLATIAIAGCATATSQSATRGPLSPAEIAKADSGRPAYTKADVEFMQGMIAHHAQAVVMARLANSNGARSDVRVLAGRIDVAQRDEIDLMQRWLRDRRENAPDPLAHHDMPGHQMSAMGPMMPGMLSAEQMSQLEAAKGPEFDRLFLTFMIQHHEGAITMVQRLFSSPGAGQDVVVWQFASEVEADQSTEIERMRTMLGTPSDSR